MLVVFRKDTGEVLDNTGTNSAMPEGPPDDMALVNIPEAEHGNVALLRLHDLDDAELVAQVLANRHHVENGQVVIDGPYPEPEPTPATPSLQDQIDELKQRLDRAANAAVTGDAKVLRDNLKPV